MTFPLFSLVRCRRLRSPDAAQHEMKRCGSGVHRAAWSPVGPSSAEQRNRTMRSLSSGAHSRDPLASPGERCTASGTRDCGERPCSLLRCLRVDLAGHLTDSAGQLLGRLRAGYRILLRKYECRDAGNALVGGVFRLRRDQLDVLIGAKTLADIVGIE